ncbi:MAG: FKBP-type peptidyl-prolyl cis-trans isomerase [Syntrophothermus sp.]
MKKAEKFFRKSLAISFILFLFILKANPVSATPEEKKKPKTGDFVSVELRYSIPVNGKDSTLFDSRHSKGGQPVKFKLPPPDFKGDLYENIMTLSVGDSGVFKINADSLFIKTFKMQQLPQGIESGSVLTFNVKLLDTQDPEMLKNNEKTALDKYLKDNHVTVAPRPSGIYIIEETKGEGPKVDTGSTVKMQFTISLVDGTPLFNSYERGEPLKFQYGKKFDTPGIDEAIGTLHKGSKAIVIVPSSMGFADKGQGNLVPPYATLIYNVEIVDVMSKAEAEKEQAEIQQKKEQEMAKSKAEETLKRDEYLKSKNITAKPTADGLYYIEKVKGTGAQAVAGKTVKVHYTGTLLDGTKFDSSVDRNEPFEFVLGQGQVIKGWDEGIAMMKVGGKATFIIPSTLGYGERDMGVIPPFSTLVFDVELLDVK